MAIFAGLSRPTSPFRRQKVFQGWKRVMKSCGNDDSADALHPWL
jgi:hypothetical protein